MHIRVAATGDAPVLRDVHLRSWIAAYTGLLPDKELAQLYERPAAYDWNDMLTVKPSEAILVAESGNKVIGFSHFGASDDVGGINGWLHRLYMVPEQWGTGAGSRLHAASLTRMRDAGFHSVGLRVLDNNRRARRFYEREGWCLDPDAGLSWSASVPDVRYRYDHTAEGNAT